MSTEPLHPSLRGSDLTDEAIAAAVTAWTNDLLGDVDPDAPIPYLIADHDVCHGCGDILCGCERHCMELAEDVCGHDGRPYCPTCAPLMCVYCAADKARWEYDPEERGEWR